MRLITILFTLVFLTISCTGPSTKRLPANSEESMMMFHWGDAVSANAPSLQDAHFPWKAGINDAHFAEINGSHGAFVREGIIDEYFMHSLFERQKHSGSDTKGGHGYYTSTDFLKWFGWNSGYDVLIVEAKANNLADLTTPGPNGPILEIIGGINPIIRRAPTDYEKNVLGISLVIRPPTEKDIERIFESQGSKSKFLSELKDAEIKLRRIPNGDRRTPVVKEIFNRLKNDYGKNYLEKVNGIQTNCKGLVESLVK